MSDADPTTTPAAPPPPGQKSNFLNPPSQAWMPRVAIYTTLPITVAFVILRLYSRFHLRQQLKSEDYLCIAAGLSSVGCCSAILTIFLNDVYGRHIWDVPRIAETTAVLQEGFAVTTLYSLAAPLTKLSLLALCHRLFSPSTRSRILIKFGVIFTIASYTAIIAVCIYSNVPHVSDMGWTDSVFLARLNRIETTLPVVLGSVGTFTDLYVIMIPLTSVARLNLSTARKIGLAALFATGLLACSFSFASLVSRAVFFHDPDLFWASAQPYALAVAEINLGIICACIPVAFPTLKLWAQKLSSVWSSLINKAEKIETISIEANIPPSPPAVPRGVMRTFLSFLRSPNDSRPGTDVINIEMVPYYNGQFIREGDGIQSAYNYLDPSVAGGNGRLYPTS
ncbi:integral membrane protein [Xylaria sp. FL1042]|nr:integral membrane protein [Xylaria sp. FL1042]